MKTLKANKITLAALSVMGLIITSTAFAQDGLFELAGTEAPIVAAPAVPVATPVATGKLVQIGEPTGNLEPLKGFARELPLITVLKQITPNGWVVKKNDSATKALNVQQPISWSGGQSWVNTLSDLSTRYNFNVLVNWRSQEIILSPVNDATPVEVVKLEKKSEGVFEIGKSLPPPTGVKVDQKPLVVGTVEPVAHVAPLPKSDWTLQADKSLKENVIAWGKAAGYRVVWNAEDYPVDQNRSFNGAFDSEEGPIRQLALDYGPESRVQQPLAFQFYQNNTLVVDDMKYEQQGFPQYSR